MVKLSGSVVIVILQCMLKEYYCPLLVCLCITCNKRCSLKTSGYGPRGRQRKLLTRFLGVTNRIVGFTMEDRMFIDKLSGPEKWATWKFQLEHLLKAKGLWGMVQETEQLAADANAQVRAEFEWKKEKAFSVLVLNVSTPQLYLITNCKTPKEAWEMLKAQFERDTVANKLFLKKKYFRCEMKEGEHLNDHLKRMKELTDQLGAIGSVIEEEDQIVTLLGSLPPSYATVVTALETKMDSLTLQFVQQALVNEEQKPVLTDNTTVSSSVSAMSSQMHRNEQSGSKTVGANSSRLMEMLQMWEGRTYQA